MANLDIINILDIDNFFYKIFKLIYPGRYKKTLYVYISYI